MLFRASSTKRSPTSSFSSSTTRARTARQRSSRISATSASGCCATSAISGRCRRSTAASPRRGASTSRASTRTTPAGRPGSPARWRSSTRSRASDSSARGWRRSTSVAGHSGALEKRLDDYVDFVYHTLIMRVYVSHPSSMYRLQPVRDLGGYDEATGPAEDKDLWRKLALERFEARIVPERLVLYRLHDQQLSQTRAAYQRRVDGASQDHFIAELAPDAPATAVRMLLAGDPEAWTHDPHAMLNGVERVLDGARDATVARERRCRPTPRPRRPPPPRGLAPQALASAHTRRRRLCDRAAASVGPSGRATSPQAVARRRADGHGRTMDGEPRRLGAARSGRDPALTACAAPLRPCDGRRMTLDVETARREKEKIEALHGPWTAHNIRLADGLYTISPEPVGDEVKLRRVDAGGSRRLRGIASQVFACSISRVSKGMYALEFAQRGAEVVAIEGREANLEKARFAARALGLEVDFQLGDVRDLDAERHGEFDLVLALGILYHLDATDLFPVRRAHRRRLPAHLDRRTPRSATGSRAADPRRKPVPRRSARGARARVDRGRPAAAVWSSLDNLTAVALDTPLARASARTAGVHQRARVPRSCGARQRGRPRHAARTEGRAGRKLSLPIQPLRRPMSRSGPRSGGGWKHPGRCGWLGTSCRSRSGHGYGGCSAPRRAGTDATRAAHATGAPTSVCQVSCGRRYALPRAFAPWPAKWKASSATPA